MAEEVGHVIVESQETSAPAAVETVVAAETAVALAGATAAAAELDAAERMRRLESEGEEWRGNFQRTLQSVSDSLRTLREDELQRHEQERLALAASFQSLSERQEAMEARLQSLIPPKSEVEKVTGEEVTEGPDLGTATEVEAGPVSLGASLGADVETNSTSSASHPVRRRRWI